MHGILCIGEAQAVPLIRELKQCMPADEVIIIDAPHMYYYARTETAKAFGRVIHSILDQESSLPLSVNDNDKEEFYKSFSEKENGNMRIAIPMASGKLALHFGHCEQFALIDVDPATKQILNQDFVAAPDHQPGLLPRWLREKGVNVVISGGIGSSQAVGSFLVVYESYPVAFFYAART